MLLLLFDVDGTLLLSKSAGAKAMQEAGKRVFGEQWTLEHVAFAGRLDPLIYADGAAHLGIEGNGVLHQRFRAAYEQALSRRLRDDVLAHLLPGVESLLERLEARDDVTLGLLTGNYPETGRLKLEAAGLDPERFLVTAWGTDGPTRRDLVTVARQRCQALTGEAPPAKRVVVIGDTEHDVDCAHAHGCRAIAVASGPAYDLDALAASAPDLLLPDLSDADAVLAWLDTL